MPGECEPEREVVGTEHRRSKSRSKCGRSPGFYKSPGCSSEWGGKPLTRSFSEEWHEMTNWFDHWKRRYDFFLALYNKLFHIHDNSEKLLFFSPLPPISGLDYPVSPVFSPRSSLNFSSRSYILASSMSRNCILLPSGTHPETIFWILPDISRAIFKPL